MYDETTGGPTYIISNSSFHGTSATQGIASWAMENVSPAGTNQKVKGDQEGDRITNPKVYFSLVKSKLKETEKDILKSKLRRLAASVKRLESTGQKAAFEEFSKALAITVKELEASAAGYSKFVNKNTINLFKKVQILSKIVHFKPIEKYPRLMPKDVEAKLTEVKEKCIFDEFWVLYLDYTGKELKTNKEKIKEKDPILFGCFSFAPERFFYITDWVDDFCDLTLEKFVEELEANHEASSDYGRFISPVEELEEPDESYLADVVAQVSARHNRLDNTKQNNFRALMAEEDETKPEKKKSFLRRLFNGS